MTARDLRVLILPIAAIVLVALALVAPSSSEPGRPPSRVVVSETAYACPAGSAITVAAGQVKAGSGSTATALPKRARDVELEDASAWRTSSVDGSGVVVQQQGRASGAVGFFAGTAPKAGGGGLVVGSCPGIVDDAWLLGVGLVLWALTWVWNRAVRSRTGGLQRAELLAARRGDAPRN